MKGFLYLLLLSVILFGCSEKKKISAPYEYTGPVLEVDNLNVSYSDSGRVIVKMNTAKQLRLQNEDEVYPKAVYVNFIDKSGVEYSSLRGDSGRFIRSDQKYKIMGNVFFYNRVAQQSLATEILYWNPQTKKIYTDEKVKINTPARQLQGVGMEAEQDFSKYTVRRPTGIFEVDSMITQPTSNTTLKQ